MIHSYGLYAITSLYDTNRPRRLGSGSCLGEEMWSGLRDIPPALLHLAKDICWLQLGTNVRLQPLPGRDSDVDAARSADVPTRARRRQVHLEIDGMEGE